MKPTYRVKDWDEHFETAESRKLKSTRWVPIPTKHDGKSYRRITQHADAAQIFCAWVLIVEVASKMPARGVLADADGPLDAEDLAVKTGFSVDMFTLALDFLSSESVGWITVESRRKPGRAARIRRDPSGSQDEAPESARTPQSPSPEGNGMEGNNKEETDSAPRSPVRRVFEFWKVEMKHPKAALDSKREKAITARLKDGYAVEDLELAVKGCKLTPHNMGKNDRNQVYDDIELICRDAAHVDRFIANALKEGATKAPPKPETVKARMLREACEDCHGTGTKIIRGKGAMPCDHSNAVIVGSGDRVESAPQASEARVS